MKTKNASVYFSKQTMLLFSAAPHLNITITFSSRILTSADILSVPVRPVCYTVHENHNYVNSSYLKVTSKTVGHCYTEIEHRNVYNEPNISHPRS